MAMCRSVRGMEGCRRRRRLHSPDNEIESPSSSHFLCITPTDAEGPSEEALLLFLFGYVHLQRLDVREVLDSGLVWSIQHLSYERNLILD